MPRSDPLLNRNPNIWTVWKRKVISKSWADFPQQGHKAQAEETGLSQSGHLSNTEPQVSVCPVLPMMHQNADACFGKLAKADVTFRGPWSLLPRCSPQREHGSPVEAATQKNGKIGAWASQQVQLDSNEFWDTSASGHCFPSKLNIFSTGKS